MTFFFKKKKDSLIKTTENRKRLESQNYQTDIILVKGLRTGVVKVHLSLNEKGYEVKIMKLFKLKKEKFSISRIQFL